MRERGRKRWPTILAAPLVSIQQKRSEEKGREEEKEEKEEVESEGETKCVCCLELAISSTATETKCNFHGKHCRASSPKLAKHTMYVHMIQTEYTVKLYVIQPSRAL